MSQTLPPAPPTDAELAAAPAFIVEGEWDDAEWRRVASRPYDLTEAEKYLYVGGPRPHPWGVNAYTGKLPDGRRVIFPSKNAHDAYQASDETRDAGKQAGLDALNAALAANAAPPQVVVQPAAHPEQAEKMLQAAAPNGSVAG